jgi:hypothetical protein
MQRIILLFLLLPMGLLAQNSSQKVISKIEKVTVFLNGAEVHRTAKYSLTNGLNELIFRDLSPQLDKQSIQLKADGKFTILSVNYQLNQAQVNRQDEISKLNLQKTEIEEKIKIERFNLLVFKREEETIQKNQTIGSSNNGVKASELKELVDFQRNRMQEIFMKQIEIERIIKKYEDEILKINQQLTSITNQKDLSMAEVVVKISAKENIPNIAFELSYFIQNAGWNPTYDLRVENISKPMNVSYKANIYQYSGEDWKDVKLSLSTANPRKSATAPLLRNWYWGMPNDYSAYYNNINQPQYTDNSQISGFVKASDGSVLPSASIQIKGTKLGTVSDANGFYNINIPPDLKISTLVFSMVGYTTQEIVANQNMIDVILKDDTQTLSEVVVTGYGGSDFGRTIHGRVPGVDIRGMNSSIRKKSSLEIELELAQEKEAPTSQTFEIVLPYSVPSDGKVYTAEIKEVEIPTEFEHFCIPKIDTDVFLNAKIMDWTKYRLLEGEANLFLEGTYIGKTTLNLYNKDTLAISFGRDKSVIVSRTLQKETQRRQVIGTNKIEENNYQITARNTKNQAINLIIEDQFPITKFKDIDIYDKKAPEAEINEDSGKITWKIALEPAKDKKIGMSYTVKSPK